MRTGCLKRTARRVRFTTPTWLCVIIGFGLCLIMSLPVLWSITAGPSYAGEVYDPTGEIESIRADIKARGYSWTAGETSMNSIPPAERRKPILDIPKKSSE